MEIPSPSYYLTPLDSLVPRPQPLFRLFTRNFPSHQGYSGQVLVVSLVCVGCPRLRIVSRILERVVSRVPGLLRVIRNKRVVHS